MKVIPSLCLFVVLSSCFLIYSSDDPIVKLFDGTTPEKFTEALTSLRERLNTTHLEDVSVHPNGLVAMRATSILLNLREENNIDCVVHLVADVCSNEILFNLGEHSFHRYSQGFSSQKSYVVIAEGSEVHIAEAFERDMQP